MVKRKWSMVSIIAIFAILFQLFALDSSNKINAANGDEITIALPNFSNVNVGSQGLIDTTGHAQKSSNKIRLTNADFQQKGGLMKSSQISLDDGFSTYFSYKIDVPDFQKYYGDGLAFIIYSADEHQEGDFTGGGLGYAGIDNSIAVEFDTYPETGGNYGGIQDPNNHDNKGGSNVPHVAIMLDGNPNHAGQADGKTPMNKIGNGFMEFENINLDYHVWVDLDPSNNTLTVTFGRGSNKNNALNRQISRVIPQGTLDTNHVFVGMTAATQVGNRGANYANANHDILSWYFMNSHAPSALANPTDRNTKTQGVSHIGIGLEKKEDPLFANITTFGANGQPFGNKEIRVSVLDKDNDVIKYELGNITTDVDGTYKLENFIDNLDVGKYRIRATSENGGATAYDEFWKRTPPTDANLEPTEGKLTGLDEGKYEVTVDGDAGNKYEVIIEPDGSYKVISPSSSQLIDGENGIDEGVTMPEEWLGNKLSIIKKNDDPDLNSDPQEIDMTNNDQSDEPNKIGFGDVDWTDTTIIVNPAVEGQQYAVFSDDGKTLVQGWVTADDSEEVEFTGLTPDKKYKVKTRLPGDQSGKLPSKPLEMDVTTDKSSANDVKDSVKDAKGKVDNRSKEAKDAIDANPNLTDDQKDALKNKVDEQAKKAKEEIGRSTNSNEDFDDLLGKFDGIAGLIEKTAEALDTVEEGDDHLSPTQKGQLIGNLNDALDDYLDDLDGETDPDIIGDIVDDASGDIDAKQGLIDKTNEVLNDIDNFPDLSNGEKDKLKGNITGPLSGNLGKIDSAVTPEDRDKVKDDAIDELKNKQAVIDRTNKALEDIDNDPNLSHGEKEKLKGNIVAPLGDHLDAIDKAQTPGERKDITDGAIGDIDAKQAVIDRTSDAIQGVKDNDELSDDEKTSLIKALEDGLNDELDAIDKASESSDPDAVEEAKDLALARIAAKDRYMEEYSNLDPKQRKYVTDKGIFAQGLADIADEDDPAKLADDGETLVTAIQNLYRGALEQVKGSPLTDEEWENTRKNLDADGALDAYKKDLTNVLYNKLSDKEKAEVDQFIKDHLTDGDDIITAITNFFRKNAVMTGEDPWNNFSDAQKEYINAFLSMHGYDDGFPGLLAEAKASPYTKLGAKLAQTGDNYINTILNILIALSAGAIGFMFYYRKRKQA